MNATVLTIQQKSAYLIIFNATMISRSLGKSFKPSKEKGLKDFKKSVFGKLDKLTELMDKGRLTEDKIVDSIQALSNEFPVSFGQAQKAINVILKYHFYLTQNKNDLIRRSLHCPIDSVILKALGKKGVSLTRLDKENYDKVQDEIKKRHPNRIDFDRQWDEQHLRKNGIEWLD